MLNIATLAKNAMSVLPRLAIFASRSATPKRWDFTKFVEQVAANSSLFAGIEISLPDLGADEVEHNASVNFLQSQDLQLVADISSTNDVAITDFTQQSPSHHIKAFESQLHHISKLGDTVKHINLTKSGLEEWDITTAAEYLAEVLALSAQFLEDHPHMGRYGRETDIMGGSPHHLTGITHETNKKGILYHPHRAVQLMEILPPLRITASNIQQWREPCGYRWGFAGGGNENNDTDDDGSKTLKVDIVPHIDHIRASIIDNIGESSSLDRNILAANEELWGYVWDRKAKRGVEQVMITPDLSCGEMTTRRSSISGANDGGANRDNLLWGQTIKAAESIRRSYAEWSASVTVDKK